MRHVWREPAGRCAGQRFRYIQVAEVTRARIEQIGPDWFMRRAQRAKRTRALRRVAGGAYNCLDFRDAAHQRDHDAQRARIQRALDVDGFGRWYAYDRHGFGSAGGPQQVLNLGGVESVVLRLEDEPIQASVAK